MLPVTAPDSAVGSCQRKNRAAAHYDPFGGKLRDVLGIYNDGAVALHKARVAGKGFPCLAQAYVLGEFSAIREVEVYFVAANIHIFNIAQRHNSDDACALDADTSGAGGVRFLALRENATGPNAVFTLNDASDSCSASVPATASINAFTTLPASFFVSPVAFAVMSTSSVFVIRFLSSTG